MSCDCCCNTLVIPVSSVTVTTTATELVTTTTLATTLIGNRKFILVLDPKLLPVNALPVVLTDGTTTIPLTMENGNVMRENIFEPFALSVQRCGSARIKCFYGADSAHVLVFFDCCE